VRSGRLPAASIEHLVDRLVPSIGRQRPDPDDDRHGPLEARRAEDRTRLLARWIDADPERSDRLEWLGLW